MTVFSAAIDDLFADPNIACVAVWRAGGVGDGINVRVVTRRPDQVVGFGDSRAILPTMLIDVRRSEVSEPASGDSVTAHGEGEFEAGPTVATILVRRKWRCFWFRSMSKVESLALVVREDFMRVAFALDGRRINLAYPVVTHTPDM